MRSLRVSNEIENALKTVVGNYKRKLGKERSWLKDCRISHQKQWRYLCDMVGVMAA